MTRTRSRPIRPRPDRGITADRYVGHPRGSVTARIICRDCGMEILSKPAYLICDCGVGFVAQWDRCVARGVYLGRIQFPDQEEVTP